MRNTFARDPHARFGFDEVVTDTSVHACPQAEQSTCSTSHNIEQFGVREMGMLRTYTRAGARARSYNLLVGIRVEYLHIGILGSMSTSSRAGGGRSRCLL
jgi:hypothetical protein